MYSGVPCTRFFGSPLIHARPKSITFTSPVRLSITLFGLMSAWQTPRRCMWARASCDLLEDLNVAGEIQPWHLVERLAVDEFEQKLDFPGAEEPVPFAFEAVDLEQVRMAEQAGDAELELRLLEKLFLLAAGDRHHLEGVLPAVLLAAHVKDGAVRAVAERAERLDGTDRFVHGEFPGRLPVMIGSDPTCRGANPKPGDEACRVPGVQRSAASTPGTR